MEGISAQANRHLQNNYQFNDDTEVQHQDFSDGTGLELYATDFKSDAPNTIDCSRLGREVAIRAGYNIPRVAFDQASWYQRNGHWDNNVNNILVSDHIFWKRGINSYHTGVVASIIMQVNGTRIIQVVQAQTYKHKPGSIQMHELMANGQINGFKQPFVGVGRYP